MIQQLPLRRVAQILNGGTPTADEDNWAGDVPWATPVDLGKSHGGSLCETGRTLTTRGAKSGSTIAPAGSILLSTRAPIGYVSRAEVSMAFNQGCKALVPGPGLDSRYLAYSLMHLGPEMAAHGQGSTFSELSSSALGSLRTHLPELRQQCLIAAFLDRETARIDALIGKQERLIDVLGERRGAMITHAVTRGLDAGVPMRESGDEWLGRLPWHWGLSAVKRVAREITDGAHISPDTEGGVHDFVSTRDLGDDGIDFEGSLKTTPESYDYLVRAGCQPADGDVLFSKDGTVGRTTVVRGSHPFVVASSLIIIRPDCSQIHSDFLNYACQSHAVQEQVRSFVKGAGLPRISITNLKRIVIPRPPLEEQQAIATYLDAMTAQADALVRKAKAMNVVLRERRSALISAAVTGKIDVTIGIEGAA